MELLRYAEQILHERVPGAKISKCWGSRFMDRNKDRLKCYFSRQLEHKRAVATNPDVITDFFDKFSSKTAGILPENI